MATTVNFNEIVAKVVGAKRLGYALVQKNTSDSLTFGDVKFLARMKKISMAPSYAENELDSNDAVEEEGNEITGWTVTVDATGVKPETEAELYGHKMDANGGMIEKEGDQPPKIALLAELSMSKDANNTTNSKFVVLYCGAAKHPTEEGESKTKSGFTYSTPTIEFSFGKALNGLLKYSIRTDAENYNKEIGDTWFDAVKLPPAEQDSEG